MEAFGIPGAGSTLKLKSAGLLGGMPKDIPSLLRGLPPKAQLLLPPRLWMQTPKDLPSPALASTWTVRRGPWSARKGWHRGSLATWHASLRLHLQAQTRAIMISARTWPRMRLLPTPRRRRIIAPSRRRFRTR